MKSIKYYLPILQWLPQYTRRDFWGDLVAGLTVGVMLIPQGMAYAILGGLPPIYGLYASLVPLLVYPIFGTSRHLAVGIMAIDMLIMSAGLVVLAEVGSAHYIELAFLLALMVGLIQMVMGVARLGFVVTLLSRPVIGGFTAAAALTIGFSQIKNLLGVPLERTQFVYEVLWEALQHVSDVHPLTLGIGLGGILLLLAIQRWVPVLPGPLIAVVLASAAVWWFRLQEVGVAIVGDIPIGLPKPVMPSFDAGTLRALLPTAITLSLVQFMSVISLGKVFAARHRYSIKPNRELFALGALNFLGGGFQSMPVSGSFSRTAVGDRAGSRTAMTNVVATGVIILTLLFLTPLFYYLPIPIFASIIMVAAFGMIDVKELRFLLRTKRVDGSLAILTFLSTLFIGIHQGVLIGVAFSVVAIMYRISRPNVAVLGHLPDTRSFRDIDRHPEAKEIEGILMLRVDASFSFANADMLKDLILEKSQPEDHAIHAVIIDASSTNDLDMTAEAVLKAVADTLHERGIELYFGGAKGPVLDVLKRSGLYDQLGKDHFFLSPHRAVKSILTSWVLLENTLRPCPESPAGNGCDRSEV